MAYYTKYEISVKKLKKQTKEFEDLYSSKEYYEVLKKIQEVSGYKTDYIGDGVRWYNHKKDLIEVSEMFPDVLIELKGIGEEYDDIWILYVYNGKMQKQKAKIVYPDMDKEDLGIN